MIRITKPEKWKDTFFLKLSPIQKLVFIYLFENADDAGFFDINFSKMVNEIGISNEEIALALKKLEKTFIVSVDTEKIWIKKFLLHQNRLPIDLKTPEGNYIKFQLENNNEKFNKPAEFDAILKNIKKVARAKVKSEFVKPSINEVVSKFKEGEWSYVSEQQIHNIYDYYESVGWKVGKKPMVDWKLSFINCFRRNVNKYVKNNVVNQTKMEAIIIGNEQINGFDFNTLKK